MNKHVLSIGAKVSDEASNIPSPFDVRTIKYLVQLMSKHDLSEIDLREGELRIRLRRGAGEPGAPPVISLTSVPGQVAAPTVAASPSNGPPAAPAAAAKPGQAIKSPTPGTFYSSPTPDAEPFVRVGSRVSPSTVVCIIEAMKIFNEITADCSGVITEVCVNNQQAVEYNQALFKVDTGA